MNGQVCLSSHMVVLPLLIFITSFFWRYWSTFDHYDTPHSHGSLLHQAFYYLVYPADTQRIPCLLLGWQFLYRNLTLRTPSWSNRYSTSWSHWNLSPELIRTKLFLLFKLSLEVCKAQYSRRALVFRLTFLLHFSNYSLRWRWHRMAFVDMKPTVFGLRRRTKRLTAFVNLYPVIWLVRFILYVNLVLSFREGLVFSGSAHDNRYPRMSD